MHREWNMRFANSGVEALKLLAEWTADVVVSDMRMPQMNGAQLLNEIKLRHPRTARLILSGFSDLEMIMQCISGTHQFLSKPCNAETLKDVVGRALEIDAWVNNDKVEVAGLAPGQTADDAVALFRNSQGIGFARGGAGRSRRHDRASTRR